MNKLLSAWGCALGIACAAHAATTIDAADFAAWGANIGWLNWRGNVASGAAIGEYVCSGYVWGANVGWIHLGDGTPVNGIAYQNNAANDYGLNHDGFGHLSGLAWGANIGWINFHPLGNPRFNLDTGKFIGYAWGANVGWISLSNAFAHVETDVIQPGADTDGDGIADAWELLKFGHLAAANATSDFDGDGYRDIDEYGADTDPLDPLSALQITLFDTGDGGTPATIRWLSRESRRYYVLTTPNLTDAPLPADAWSDVGLGRITPDAGASTTRAFANPPLPERHFQIQAVKPLAP